MTGSFSSVARLALLAGCAVLIFGATIRAESLWVFIGTGGGGAKGIYRSELDLATGKLTKPEAPAPGQTSSGAEASGWCPGATREFFPLTLNQN